LLSWTLSLNEVWDSGESRWASLFAPGPVSSELRNCLAPVQLALVFSPNQASPVPARLRQAGVPAVHWVPSFPEGGREAVAALQARHLSDLGFAAEARPFRLALPENPGEAELADLSGAAPWLAVAPGSGHPRKSWPLSHYYEVTRALAWEHKLRVVWVAGPAEAAMVPYLTALTTAQGHVLLNGAPLERLAAVLARCRLFLGNDSGLTHLAAALGGPEVVALFGPTDPRVWAPPGARVRVLTGPCPKAPCARGREIPCPESHCLRDLAPERVLQAAGEILSASLLAG
jgi:ADP-heptose:LPS heptosyltransferase